MPTTWTFHTAGRLAFGPGALGLVGETLREMGAKRAALVTDATLAAAGLAGQTLAVARESGCDIFVYAGGMAEPTLDAVAVCHEALRAENPDAVIALGGGSNMDLAKFAAVLLDHGGSARDYLGDGKVPGPMRKFIAIPTTAGTGSEVSGAAAFTDSAASLKVGALSNYLRPHVALVDPLLTYGCPPPVTASSGIDALAHAVEAYTAIDYTRFPLAVNERSVYQGAHPLADVFAERAIQLVGQHLVTAVRDGSNAVAREGMMLAATLAGLAFSNAGVAAVHALEYPVGGLTGCPHGMGNGLLLPHVMRFNVPANPLRFARIAELLGEDVQGMSVDDAALRSVVAVERLRDATGVPARLRDYGVTVTDLPKLAEQAAGIRRMLRVNPRAVSAADALAIYEAAF